MLKNLTVFVFLVLVCGCATGYGPKGFSGGYIDTQLQPNVFQVQFNGNGYTSASRARDFCLLRCAELCVENGFTHFVILDQASEVSKHTYFSSATTTTTGGQTYQVSKPGTENIIACYRDVKTPVPQEMWEATFLISSLKKKYGIKEK